MKEQFATYEIAKKLKELGFNDPVCGYFKGSVYSCDNTEGVFCWLGEWLTIENGSIVAAPLWQQVIDWLRKTHDIIVEFKYRKDVLGWSGYNRCYFKISKGLDDYDSRGKFKNSFYSDEILMKKEAILKAIEICQKENQ